MPTPRLAGLALHVTGGEVDRAELAELALPIVLGGGEPHVTDEHWLADDFDFWSFDRTLDELAHRGEPLVVRTEARHAVAIARQIAIRAQRLAWRCNGHTTTSWFERVLDAHRALHDVAKPLVRADLDHALDAWQWTLRRDAAAPASVQLAAMLHDIERLASEPDERIEHRAPDYQTFKDAHARAGARLAAALLSRCDVPDAIAREAVALVEVHERPGEGAAIALINDADSLSFFSLNSPGYLAYFGEARTADKVAYTLDRMTAGARSELPALRVPRTVRVQIDAWLTAHGGHLA